VDGQIPSFLVSRSAHDWLWAIKVIQAPSDEYLSVFGYGGPFALILVLEKHPVVFDFVGSVGFGDEGSMGVCRPGIILFPQEPFRV